jgi:hypothetical protein
MKIIFTVVVLILLYLTAYAQLVSANDGTGKFQSVSGDFAQTWIKNYLAKNPSPVPQVNNTSLWGWGAIPKGKALVGGKLVDNFTYSQNMTANWLGDYYLNPYTSEPINPAYYPGYVIPVYSSPVYTNPYSPQQQYPVIQMYP